MKQEGAGEDEVARRLLRRIESRDQNALAEIQRLLGRRIHAFSLRLVRDADLANQVVTDTIFDVWRYPERFNGQSKVSTWILAIAKHKALHAIKQKHTEHVDLDDISETFASGLGDPEASSVGGERATALWRCLQRLSEVHRECLHLVFYEGMLLSEVASFQHVPEGTVKTRVFHAKKSLRACLEGVIE